MKDPDYDTIWGMFHGRCVVCCQLGDTIHEIIPRAYGFVAMEIENRVVLCNPCHNRVHREGTRFWEHRLRDLREVRLDAFRGTIACKEKEEYQRQDQQFR